MPNPGTLEAWQTNEMYQPLGNNLFYTTDPYSLFIVRVHSTRTHHAYSVMIDMRPRELSFALLGALAFLLGYFITSEITRAQDVVYEPKTADVVKLAMDCLTFWKFTTIIFIRFVVVGPGLGPG